MRRYYSPLLSIMIHFLTFSDSSSLAKWPGPEPRSIMVLKLRFMSYEIKIVCCIDLGDIEG